MIWSSVQFRLYFWRSVEGTYTSIMEVNSSLKELARKESRNVGCVRGHENDGESTPDVDEEFVGPRLRSLGETDQSGL